MIVWQIGMLCSLAAEIFTLKSDRNLILKFIVLIDFFSSVTDGAEQMKLQVGLDYFLCEV